ncbi:uncharacterized protein BCR38DRAFT_488137 [Pseudomassariella vexata]|uniref:C2H2-type domain-containing protein n=1 Tax=Pseudomassariella vexata TaxID=1141098 RepID=A0A1Y2DL39_9PEZI|nr:uncharacterized protein BCR38DRAFT_488137 [Pseudomassariella vexata]ORY59952.1 hypothetical protein BCR38DRAFT_488137 [Pseudomassariella vexata]
MDHPPKDKHVGFDEDFDFGSQPVSCSSSSIGSSFSTTASTASSYTTNGPFTPTSASRCSTPQQVLPFDHVTCQSSTGYEIHPAFQRSDGLASAYIKPEARDSLTGIPDKRNTLPIMEYNYDSVLSSTLTPQGLETNGMDSYPYSNPMTNPPFHLPTPSYTTDTTFDNSVWHCQDDTHMMFFERYDPQVMKPSPVQNMAMRDRNYVPQSYLASNGRRRLSIEHAQQRTGALNRAQSRLTNRPHSFKRESYHNKLASGVQKIPAGTFKCTLPNCTARRAFKRSEHLKRHITTAICHNPDIDSVSEVCIFCSKKFNRRDNWRQHLKLHTMKGRSISRTDFHPKAQELYDEEMRKTKHRSQFKKGAAAAELKE